MIRLISFGFGCYVGNAEWQDSSHGSLRIMWKSPQTLAGEVYSWAARTEILGTVFTIYELHSGDESHDSGSIKSISVLMQLLVIYYLPGFYGVDPVVLRKALELLETNG